MSVLLYTPRAETERLLRERLGAFTAAFIREGARPNALRAADARDREALADKWLDEAYEAERDGNPNRMRYIGYWLNRMAA